MTNYPAAFCDSVHTSLHSTGQEVVSQAFANNEDTGQVQSCSNQEDVTQTASVYVATVWFRALRLVSAAAAAFLGIPTLQHPK